MNIISRDIVYGRGMQIATIPRPRWGWGLHNNRLNNTGRFSSFNLHRLVYKQKLVNSNLGAFIKYWKGQKRQIIATSLVKYFMTKWTIIGPINERNIIGAINERFEGEIFYRDRSQVGGRYSERKRLVSEILGFRSWCWSINPTTIH